MSTEETILSPVDIERYRLERNFKKLRQLFKKHDVADIAEALVELGVDETVVYLRFVPREKRAELFAHLPFERQEELLEELPDNVVTTLVNEMQPDDRTRMLEELPFEIRGKIMLKLSPEERKVAWQLLSYPEDSVGRLMSPPALRISADMSVGAAIDCLRWSPNVPEEQVHVLFVTDAEDRYLGDVSLAALVTADPPTLKVRDVMNLNSFGLNVNADQEEAVDFFRKYDRQVLAVVDDTQTLVGVVTPDDVFEVAEEEATEDIQQFGGQATLEDSYFNASLFQLFHKRAVWLVVLFMGGTITAGVLRAYEGMAASMAWLVFFAPLIISSGGNTGSQAASLVIRGIAVREMDPKDWIHVLWREVLVGLTLGITLGAMGYGMSQVWNLDPVIGLIVAVSLVGVVSFGAVTGSMLPFIFKRMNLDPAVSSSPLLAQLVDVFGVLIFYNTARVVISYWESIQ